MGPDPDPGGPKTYGSGFGSGFRIRNTAAHILAFESCFIGPLSWNSKWTQCSARRCTVFVLVAIHTEAGVLVRKIRKLSQLPAQLS